MEILDCARPVVSNHVSVYDQHCLTVSPPSRPVSGQYGGISTSVQVDEASTIITLDDYVDGMATVRIINHTTEDDVAYHQKPFEQRR